MRSRVTFVSVPGAVRVAAQYRYAWLTEAPGGRASTAVLRACSGVIVRSAAACPSSGESARQYTSGAVSTVLSPQAPTVPTVGAGVPAAHSWASVLPISTKSPF